jgi:formate/nitrite transporter FocA (FNT family)
MSEYLNNVQQYNLLVEQSTTFSTFMLYISAVVLLGAICGGTFHYAVPRSKIKFSVTKRKRISAAGCGFRHPVIDLII